MLLLLIILFSLTLGTKRGLFHFDIIISISRYDDLSYNILIVTPGGHTIMHSKIILGYQNFEIFLFKFFQGTYLL